MRVGKVVWVCADACEDVSANAGAGMSTGERVQTGVGGGMDAGERGCGCG